MAHARISSCLLSSVATSQPGTADTWDKSVEYVVYAPAGKLGIVLDNPDDKGPVVYIIKESSPLMDKIEVGDRLVAVDEVDVRAMSPTKVSKLISKRSANPMRKFTLLRHKKPPKEDDGTPKNQSPSSEEEKNADEEEKNADEEPEEEHDLSDPPTQLTASVKSNQQQEPAGISPKTK